MDERKGAFSVGSKSAGYLFEFTPGEGVFLTVYPVESGGLMFELSDMRQILKDYGVLDYDITALARSIREGTGERVKLADSFTPLPTPTPTPETESNPDIDVDDAVEAVPVKDLLEDLGDLSDLGINLADLGIDAPSEEEPEEDKPLDYARVTVDVSRDRMKATVRIDMKPDTLRPTMDMVLKELENRNVVYGIDMAAIQRGVESSDNFVAANGVPPVNGEDAYIDRKFDLGVKGRPVANQYDQVDYKNLNLFVLAKKGDLLAVRVPQTQGKPGKDVYGNDVPARHGRPIPVPAGKNTKVVEDDSVVADMDGQIIDDGKRISIDPRLVIKGDVGMKTGNIDFDGSVDIGGNVETGFIVKATGDITIKGMISGAQVEGRNVTVGGGVNGMGRGQVKAQEDVRIAFAENANVEAGSNIYVIDVSLHSTLKAGKCVVVEGKNGQIVGGYTAAGEEIKATMIGNPANVVTKLAVGVNPNLLEKYQRVCKDYAEAKKRLQQVTRALNTLGKIDVSQLPKERVDQINALTRSQFPLAGQVQRDEKIIRKLDEELHKLKKGHVKASNIIYPGVRMTINSIMKNVQTEERHCTMSAKGEEIHVGPY